MKNIQAKKYKVKKYSVGSDERVLKIEGGRDLNTKVNVGTMLKLLGGSIYKSNVSAFREQLVNAISHGCIAANESDEGGVEAFVEVQFDFNKRRVTITDVNGMGIPWNVMDEVVTSLGDSGNNDRTRSGQFGCGMFSFIRMADTTILETWSKETDEHYAYISEGSKWHEIENRELSETGTRIMITFKPEVDMLELVESCKNISDFQPVDVIIRVQGWQKVEKENKVSDYGRQKADNKEWFKGNGVYRLGKNLMGEDLGDKVGLKYGDHQQQGDVIKLEDKDNDIEVYFSLPTTPFDGYGSFADQYLCNIPIGGGIEFNGMTGVRINFTNEKTWSPPVDRDRLTDESMKMAEKLVSGMITDWLKKIEIKTVNDFKTHKYPSIINSRRLDEYLNEDTRNLLDSLRKQFTCWSFSPDGDNQSAEYMRKNKPRTFVYNILKHNNIFSTPKIDKRLYNLFADHFPEGFTFIIGHTHENTVKELDYAEREQVRLGTSKLKNITLNDYLEKECGTGMIQDAVIYKKANGLKLTRTNTSGYRKKSSSTLSVTCRKFSYYGSSETYDTTGKDVNKSVLWLKDKNHTMVKNTFQNQYYNGSDDFSFRGLTGKAKISSSRGSALNQTLFDTFWTHHKFIVKQIPKNIQNAVTEFFDFRDSIFATKMFHDKNGVRLSLIEILRKLHPELKNFEKDENLGTYKVRVVTNKELFDKYRDLEEPDHEIFYMELDFRPDNPRTEFAFLSNLYMSMVMTNLTMSDSWSGEYSSHSVLGKGLVIDFSEDDLRRELFSKNDLYDKFKYMDQNAPSDFLNEFEKFNKKYSKNFSQEVMDVTCYLLSALHSGMNSVFMEHNNNLTTEPNVKIKPQFRLKGDVIVKHDSMHYGNKSQEGVSIQSTYYYAAKLVETFIEKQLEKQGMYCLRTNDESDSSDYRVSSHLLFVNDDEKQQYPSNHNKIVGGLTNTLNELQDLYIDNHPTQVYETSRSKVGLKKVLTSRDLENKLDIVDFKRQDDVLIGPLLEDERNKHQTDIYLDTYGNFYDVSFFIQAIVESLESNNSNRRGRGLTPVRERLFEIICEVYNLDHLVQEGIFETLKDSLDSYSPRMSYSDDERYRPGLLSKSETRTSRIKEGDVITYQQNKYGFLDSIKTVNLKVVKIPPVSKLFDNSSTDHILLEIDFEDDPFLIAKVIPDLYERLDGRYFVGDGQSHAADKWHVSFSEPIKRKDGRITMNVIIKTTRDR
jgi:hypothetical protein